MEKIKRIVCVILVAVLLVGCFAVSAFAENETVTGYYDGYGFVASANCSSSSYSSYITYLGGYYIKINATIRYMDIWGDEQTGYATQTSIHDLTIYQGFNFVDYYLSNNSRFFINNSKVATLTEYAN